MVKHQNSGSATRHPAFLTIDVEEYYHILGVSGLPPLEAWDRLPSRVGRGLEALYSLLEERKTKATLFFLGYIARNHPQLVRRAVELGHELASHGMYHQEVNRFSRNEFRADASDSRKLLEDLGGKPVIGWRSAGFSVSGSCSWLFEELLNCGYCYDSSLVPGRYAQKGIPGSGYAPGWIETPSGNIFEFPISISQPLGLNMFGGGYLRFFPSWLISRRADQLLRDRPLLIYIHPRELDPEHPRIKMNLYRYFKSYVNMRSVPAKLRLLLDKTYYQTLGEYYERQLRQG